jgi:hypothetical protein
MRKRELVRLPAGFKSEILGHLSLKSGIDFLALGDWGVWGGVGGVLFR